MSYQALYRAWRPPSFADMVHQPHVKQTLQNAIMRNQVAHAYLFCGPRGTGKTSAAKILAKAVNCLDPQGADPCNHCAACESINNGSNVDVEEIDAASNRGVDEIRQLRDKVQYAPASLKKKVYIVDEVHMLTSEAFNALLKTLEEPPLHVLFILATTEPHKLPETIVSRCQRFDFRRIPDEVVVERLRVVCNAQGWPAEPEALWHIAAAADGGLRDALGLLEQTAAYGSGQITAADAAHVVGGVATGDLLGLVAAVESRNLLEALTKLSDWHAMGKDTGRIVSELLHLLRDLFIVKMTSEEAVAAGSKEAHMKPVASALSMEWLLAAVGKLGELYTQLRYIDQPRIALEATLVGLATVSSAVPPAVQPAVAPVVESASAARATPPAPTVSTPDAGIPAAEPVAAPTAPAASVPDSKLTKANAQRRKLEALQTIAESATPEALARIETVWTDILQTVKAKKIQTYAWLMGGKPMLATGDMVLVAFSVQIHRDNVMKSDERAMIESAMSEVLLTPTRFQAILQSDWEAYASKISQVDVPAREQNWVDDVVNLFGKDVVEIRMEDS